MGVRAALGAASERLFRQVLTESLLISLVGALLGFGLAVGGVRLLVSLLPEDFPRGSDIHVNLLVFGFTFALSVGTAVLFGVAPALQLSRLAPGVALRDESRSATAGRGHARLRNALVVGEVALACVLLWGPDCCCAALSIF